MYSMPNDDFIGLHHHAILIFMNLFALGSRRIMFSEAYLDYKSLIHPWLHIFQAQDVWIECLCCDNSNASNFFDYMSSGFVKPRTLIY